MFHVKQSERRKMFHVKHSTSKSCVEKEVEIQGIEYKKSLILSEKKLAFRKRICYNTKTRVNPA